MRTIDTDHEFLIANTMRVIQIRVQIEDGDGSLQDVSDFVDQDWLLSVEWGSNVESEADNAVIHLARQNFEYSLAPLNKTARTNLNAGGSWDPLLAINREVVISARYASDFVSNALGYMEMFRGAIDSIDWGSEVIEVHCRDQFRHIQDLWIEDEGTYSLPVGVPVEDVMQDILDDWDGVTTLYTPSSPGWNVLDFKSERQSIADQLLLLANQIGWRLKYLWDSGTSTFRLTLIEPQRTKVAVDRVFTDSEYYDLTNVEVDISSIRNRVTVTYPDSTVLRRDGTPKKKVITVEDAGSIAAYGLRWMGVTEAGSSIISTSTEATTMANAMLSDLKTPVVTQNCEMPFFAFVELDDLYTFTGNNVHSTVDTNFAVVGYRHSFSEGKARTNLQLREEAPVGKHLSWLPYQAAKGIARPQNVDHTKVKNISVRESTLGLHVSWDVDAPLLSGLPSSGLMKDNFYEIHVTLPGMSPDTVTFSSLIGTTRGNSFIIHTTQDGLVPVDEASDIHVRAVGKFSESAFDTASNKSPQMVGSAGIDIKSAPFDFGISHNFNEQSKGTGHPIDGWLMDTGDWDADALQDDGTVYTGVEPIYGSKFLLLK
jgi:hypothetical protein